VDNTVMRLRKKLGPLGEDIETVWGIGYRLRPERE
jgi:DNA-binding response OmpR family regulator